MIGSGVFPFSNSKIVGKPSLCPRYAGESEPESLADALFEEKVKGGLDRPHPDFPNRQDTIWFLKLLVFLLNWHPKILNPQVYQQ